MRKSIKNKSHPFVSKHNPVFYIAEIGAAHEGDYEYAKQLTHLALDSGADAVKFQFYTGDTLVSSITGADSNAHFKRMELTNKQNLDLIRIVDAGGAIPMASIWSQDILTKVDSCLSIHKVGSGDLTCYPMLAALAFTGKPIILSTGLSSLKEVSEAVAYIDSCNASYIEQRKLALLQCTASYPTPDVDANIEAMLVLKQEFGLPVGYSDHTIGSDAIEVAVTLGAEIIEKHFTDEREGKTYHDHKLSLTCEEVRKTITKMKRIVTLKGKAEKLLTLSESDVDKQILFRRSIYAAHNIEPGEILTSDNLTTLRPAVGLCASHYDEVIGKTVVRAILKNQVIQKEDICY